MMGRVIEINGLFIGDGYPCHVCAELGTNPAGDMRLAKELIDIAADAGCTLVKAQKRTPELAVPEHEWHELRDTPWGKMSKIEYRRRVEFHVDQHAELQKYAMERGMLYHVSVWDIPSVSDMVSINMPLLKIPSARVHDKALIEAVAFEGRTTFLSTGMSTWQDVEEAVDILDVRDLLLYQCTSAYPSRSVESDLRVIQEYRAVFNTPVGFSSHKIGIETCLLAVACGANVIERHVTTDRALPGSDHRMSSEPDDLKRLVSEVRRIEAILGDGKKKVHDCEQAERKRLRGA